jgi:hypothetical protein
VNRPNHQRPCLCPGKSRCVLAWLVLLFAVIASPTAVAANGGALEPRVLLVVDTPNDPLLERIEAEVSSLGLAVIRRASSGPLEQDARAQRAIAAIRVLPSRKGVEVWMADVTTGRALARQLVVDERPEGPDQGLIALQTAEILRTGLFPKPEQPAAPPAPIIIVTPSPPPEPTSSSTVATGVGALWSHGGAGTALQALLSLGTTWRRGLGIALDLSFPLRRADLSGPEGTAQVAALMAGCAVFASFPSSPAHWSLTTGVGAAALNLRIDARQSASYPMLRTSAANAITGLAYARVEAAWKPSHWAKLGLAGIAGSSFNQVTIRFAGNPAGTWGKVILGAVLLFGVEWE